MRLSPEKLVIKGEFETKTAINELTYQNIYAMKSKNVTPCGDKCTNKP